MRQPVQMELKEIKRSIAKADLEVAIEALSVHVSGVHETEYLTISARYHMWKKEKDRGDDPPVEVQNQIIYSLLEFISELEIDIADGLQRQVLQVHKKYEGDLKNGYELLQEVKYGTNPDKLDDLIQSYSGRSSHVSRAIVNQEVQREDLAIMLSKHIRLYERLYKLMIINVGILVIILVILPFLVSKGSLIEQFLHEVQADTNGEDDDDGD
ncbi:MAG: hypothetical protein AAGI38_15855 [Bacteroidota bacterium]